MIREFFEYHFTPASHRAKKSGYLYEAISFQSRGRRLQTYWQPHWETCQKLVIDFVNQHPQAQTIGILGSGCLFEMPQDFLIQRFNKICLFDQVFPRQVRSWARKHAKSVQMIEMDLVDEFPRPGALDLLISANLLSQISLPLESENEKKRVELKHLENIQAAKCPTLLWTDVERILQKAETSEFLQTEKTVQIDFLQSIQEWNWNLAPAPEISKQYDVSLKMKARLFEPGFLHANGS